MSRRLISLFALLASLGLSAAQAGAYSRNPQVVAAKIELSGSVMTRSNRAAKRMALGKKGFVLITANPSYGVRLYRFLPGKGPSVKVRLNGRAQTVRTFLFDIDGTVVDTRAVIRATILGAAEKVGMKLTDEQLATLATGQAYTSVVKVLLPNATVEAQVALSDWMSKETQRREAEGEAQPYQASKEMFLALKALGVRIGAVTSRPTRTAVSLLKNVGYSDVFEVVVGSEHEDGQRNVIAGKMRRGRVNPHKPGPEPILEALRLMGGQPGDSIYIGDTPGDIAAAHHAGLSSVALTHGFGKRGDLGREQPDAMLDGFDELKKLLAN